MTALRVTNTILEVHADWDPAVSLTQYGIEVALRTGQRKKVLRYNPLTGKLCPVCCPIPTGEAQLVFDPLQLTATASFDSDYVGTAAAQQTMPMFTMNGAGTHTPPVFTASGQFTFAGVTLFGQAATGDVFLATAPLTFDPLAITAAGTHVPPVFSAAASLTFDPLAITATAAYTPPTVTADAQFTFAGVTLTGLANFSAFIGSGSAQLTFDPLAITATATHTPPVFSGAAPLTFDRLQLSAFAAIVGPFHTATAQLTFDPLEINATAIHVTPASSGSAALTFDPLEINASAAFSAGVFLGAAQLTFDPLQLTATATFAPGTRSGAATLTFDPLQLTSTATFSNPQFSGDGQFTFAGLQFNGFASFAGGVFVGSSQLTFDPLALTSTATFTSPVKTGQAGLTFDPLQLTATATHLVAGCCTGPVASFAYVRLSDVVDFGPCAAACAALDNLCVELSAQEEGRWTGAAFLPAAPGCYVVNIFEVDLACTGSDVIMTLTVTAGGGTIATFTKTFPGVSTIDCIGCTVHDLQFPASTAPCIDNVTAATVTFAKHLQCCNQCPSSYQLDVEGTIDEDGSGQCEDAICQALIGSYTLNFVAGGQAPRNGICRTVQTDWCKYSTALSLRCANNNFGFCEITLFVRVNDDCETEIQVEIDVDNTTFGSCADPFPNVNPAFFAATTASCEVVDVTMTKSEECPNQPVWMCEAQSDITLRVRPV